MAQLGVVKQPAGIIAHSLFCLYLESLTLPEDGKYKGDAGVKTVARQQPNGEYWSQGRGRRSSSL